MNQHDRPRCYDIRTAPRGGAVRRRCVAWLGLLLIAFNILGGAALPSRADASPLSLAPVHDWIEVCTSAGLVVMDRDGNILPSDGGRQGGVVCPFCLPLGHSGVIAMEPPGPPVPAALVSSVVVLPSDLAAFRPVASARTASPRAPPLS